MKTTTTPQDLSDVLTAKDLEAAGIALDQIPSALEELENLGLVRVTMVDGFINVALLNPITGEDLVFPAQDEEAHDV
jgi:replication initiation and membrane attachment protein DnaB